MVKLALFVQYWWSIYSRYKEKQGELRLQPIVNAMKATKGAALYVQAKLVQKV